MKDFALDPSYVHELVRYKLAVTRDDDGNILRFDRNASESEIMALFRSLLSVPYEYLRERIEGTEERNEFRMLRGHYNSMSLVSVDTILTGEFIHSTLPKHRPSEGYIILSESFINLSYS